MQSTTRLPNHENIKSLRRVCAQGVISYEHAAGLTRGTKDTQRTQEQKTTTTTDQRTHNR